MKNIDIKKALVIADPHGYHYDKNVHNIICQVAEDLKPDYLVMLGDCIDANGISKFTNKDFTEGALDTLSEIDFFKYNFYLPLKEVCGETKVMWTLGNHDGQRVTDFLNKLEERGFTEQHKFFKQHFDLKVKFPEITFCDYNQCLNIGKLYFTHGEYHNDAHAKKHALIYGKSIMYGHLHTHEEKTVASKANSNVHSGISIPCSCKLDPDYMKNRASSWVQGFAVVSFLPNGNYYHQVCKIINKKTVYNNKIYG